MLCLLSCSNKNPWSRLKNNVNNVRHQSIHFVGRVGTEGSKHSFYRNISQWWDCMYSSIPRQSHTVVQVFETSSQGNTCEWAKDVCLSGHWAHFLRQQPDCLWFRLFHRPILHRTSEKETPAKDFAGLDRSPTWCDWSIIYSKDIAGVSL